MSASFRSFRSFQNPGTKPPVASVFRSFLPPYRGGTERTNATNPECRLRTVRSGTQHGDSMPTDSPSWVLWYRPDRRHRWGPVATVPTSQDATNAIGTGGRRNGQWMTLPAGRHPEQCGRNLLWSRNSLAGIGVDVAS